MSSDKNSFRHSSREFINSGVPAKTLLEQVKNTAPFLFSEFREKGSAPAFRYVQLLNQIDQKQNFEELDHDLVAYFEFCIASHFATVGTFIPTDVDNAIRTKLWAYVRNPAQFERMWNLVQEFQTWDESLVSKRFVVLPAEGKKSALKLSGHQGEWFTIAMGAYGYASKHAVDFLPEIREKIEAQFKEQEAVITQLEKNFLVDDPTIATARPYLDGIAALAHNLGDLDRMFDAWDISEHDVLKRRVYRAGHEDARHPRPLLIKAGVIYQAMLANENHRHFALRHPKALRKSNRYLLNFGPFLDDWGSDLVKNGVNTGDLTEGDLREIVEALTEGWKRLNLKSMYTSQGYSRAIAGIMNALPRGREDLESLMPPKIRKELTEGGLRTLTAVQRSAFETKWVRKLLTL